MRKMAKLLSVFVVMTMVVSTMAFAATFSDVASDKNYYEPVSVLSAFGIINGYEDGTFGPDKNVTRAEFATMLMRALASSGFGSDDPAGTPFTDLTDASWAISDIRTAYDLGIINGMTSTTFEPNSQVTYEQALKMIVCALNYGGQAEQIQSAAPNQPWYYGYMQVAASLNLTKAITPIISQPAKRWEIAQMIFNSFDVKMLDKLEIAGGGYIYQQTNKTLLGDKLNIGKARGEILADGTDTLEVSGMTARPGYALIKDIDDGKYYTYMKDAVSLDGLLGKTVDCYFKVNSLGERSLVCVYAKSGSNTTITINAEDIDSISGSQSAGFVIKYYPTATATRASTATIQSNAVISINGEVVSGVTASQLKIESGSLELIATDGGYSKINVESYQTYVVKSINTTDKYIVDMLKPTGLNTLYIDKENTNVLITIDGSDTATISNIAKNNVLSVRIGKGVAGRTTMDIKRSTKTTSGLVRELDTASNIIDIGGKDYKISDYLYTNGSSVLAEIAVGDTVRAYLDIDGKVAYMEKIANQSALYGYIAAAGIRNEVVQVSILSSKNTTLSSSLVPLATKVKIDGKSYDDPDRILLALKAGADEKAYSNIDGKGGVYTQLIKYSQNGSGEITEIETVFKGDNEDYSDETVFKGYTLARNAEGKMKYTSSSNTFEGATTSDRFRINSNTKVFLVPSDRNETTLYARKTNTFFSNGKEYIVEAYDVTGSLNIAGAVVVYATSATESSISYTTPISIITKITQERVDGVDRDKVVFTRVSSNGTVSEKTVYTDTLNAVYGKYNVGDVVMYVTNNQGFIDTTKESKFKLIFSPSKYSSTDTHVGDHKTSGAYTCQMYAGLLLGAAEDGTNQMFDIALVENVADCATVTTDKVVTIKTASGTKFFTYDNSATDKVTEQASALDMTTLETYEATKTADIPAAAKVFIYKYGSNVRMIMVVR